MSTLDLASPLRHARVVRFEALGCTVHVEVADERDLRTARRLAATVLRDVDETASRFRADSDLAAVNAAPGTWVAVDPLLVAAVEVAVEAARRTDGLVHPLLGRPLVSLGYDRTFSALRDLGAVVAAEPPALDSWRAIEWDADAVRIPAGTALDLGATAKAWCADLIAAAWREELDDDAVISVGGDVRTLDDRPWTVAVGEHPDRMDDARLVEVTGGLATSSTRVRRWTRAGVEHHHLLDPRTGAPATTPWRTVSVVAGTCAEANTASTAALVLGADAPAWLARPDTPGDAALLLADDGEPTFIAWPTGPESEDR